MTGLDARSIHGDKSMEERTSTLQQFKQGEFPIIVATGILGRGLDLISVTQVINFDMPPTIQEYIHQVGRAGRLGNPGIAISFINDENKGVFPMLHNILKDTGSYIPERLKHSPFIKPRS